MTMPVPNTNPSTSNPAPEPKTETPPTPTEAKPAAAPARPRVAFSSLAPAERLHVCRVAANQAIGGKLPLEVRRAILADYEGVPAAAFAPDPTGPGWAEKLANGAEAALVIVVGAAAGMVGLFLLAEAAKALLRSTGLMAPAAAPAALPAAATIAPDEVGINEAKLHFPGSPIWVELGASGGRRVLQPGPRLFSSEAHRGKL